MKKLLLPAIIFFSFILNLNAQDMGQDITYCKLMNKLWTMSSGFDKVAFHLQNQTKELEKTRLTELEILDRLHVAALQDFELLKSRNYEAAEYSKVGEMMAAMESSMTDLKSEKWTEDPMWQYGYNLVKMQLAELEILHDAKPHLSKNTN